MHNTETYRGHQIEIVPSGAHGWFDFYIDDKPRGCARASQVFTRINQIINDREAAKYQPQIILDTVTRALYQEGK